MSTNGVKREAWDAESIGVVRPTARIEKIERGFSGDYFATVLVSGVVFLPSGRKIQISARRKVRGKCLNAPRGRSAGGEDKP